MSTLKTFYIEEKKTAFLMHFQWISVVQKNKTNWSWQKRVNELEAKELGANELGAKKFGAKELKVNELGIN